MKLKRRFPNYFSGFDDEQEVVYEINTIEEFKSLDWIKVDRKYAHSENRYLLVLDRYSEIHGGYCTWFVIGYIIEGNASEFGLEEYVTLIGDHLDGCPTKNWQHHQCSCGFK